MSEENPATISDIPTPVVESHSEEQFVSESSEKRSLEEENVIKPIPKKSKKHRYYEPKNPHSVAALIAKKNELKAFQFLISHLSMDGRPIWEILDDVAVKSTVFVPTDSAFK